MLTYPRAEADLAVWSESALRPPSFFCSLPPNTVKDNIGELLVRETTEGGTELLCVGYRLRWWSDIWRTDRGIAEVRSPGIRPATEDDIRHNAPGLVEETT